MIVGVLVLMVGSATGAKVRSLLMYFIEWKYEVNSRIATSGFPLLHSCIVSRNAPLKWEHLANYPRKWANIMAY